MNKFNIDAVYSLYPEAKRSNDEGFYDNNGNKIGEVTSGTMSPSLGKGIGLGYVPTVLASVDSKINIQIRKNAIPATVVKLPFYKV